MKQNQKYLIVLVFFTAIFSFIALAYLPLDIIIQFNTSAGDVSTLSKYLVLVLVLVLTTFVGLQLYDDKNANDYTRWYISGVVLIGIEIFIVVVNT